MMMTMMTWNVAFNRAVLWHCVDLCISWEVYLLVWLAFEVVFKMASKCICKSYYQIEVVCRYLHRVHENWTLVILYLYFDTDASHCVKILFEIREMFLPVLLYVMK